MPAEQTGRREREDRLGRNRYRGVGSARARPAPRRRLESDPVISLQSEGLGEAGCRTPVDHLAQSALHVAHGPSADLSAFCQLLLGEAGGRPMPFEEGGERLVFAGHRDQDATAEPVDLGDQLGG